MVVDIDGGLLEGKSRVPIGRPWVGKGAKCGASFSPEKRQHPLIGSASDQLTAMMGALPPAPAHPVLLPGESALLERLGKGVEFLYRQPGLGSSKVRAKPASPLDESRTSMPLRSVFDCLFGLAPGDRCITKTPTPDLATTLRPRSHVTSCDSWRPRLCRNGATCETNTKFICCQPTGHETVRTQKTHCFAVGNFEGRLTYHRPPHPATKPRLRSPVHL